MRNTLWNPSNRKVLVCNLITALFLNLFLEYMERKSVAEVLHFINDRTFVFLYNMLILFVCLSLVFITKKKLFVWAAVTVAWLLIGLCNGVILESRKTPFTAVDITLLKSTLPVLNSYLAVWQIVLAVILIIISVILMVWLYLYSPVARKSFDPKVNMSLFVLQCIVFGAITYVAVGRGMLISRFDNLIAGYKDYGVAYGFCITAIDQGIDRPIDYSYDKMYSLDKKINKKAAKMKKKKKKAGKDQVRTPNIIFLQLESFFDLKTVKKLSLSDDPIPHFRKLQEDYTSGYIKVPVYGAGTVNTEFEVLTGMNIAYFGTGEYPYRSILHSKTCDSMAYWLEDMPYEKTVIHNNNASFYDRDFVLTSLGFENFITIENMNVYEVNEAGWAKDSILTDEIIHTLDTTKKQDLIYVISVQGHGDYPTTAQENAAISVTGEGLDEDYLNQLTYYANQTSEMDVFIGDLINQLSKYPEDTMVIAYGDHLPGMDFKDGDLTSKSKYRTPYFIWDNFGYNSKHKKKESGNLKAWQLASKVFEQMGISEGITNRYHQTMKKTKNYRKNLKLLQYDMLYGSDFITKEEGKVRERTVLNHCLRDIVIEKAAPDSDGCCIYGKNFTTDSRVYVNGRAVKTTFHSRYMLKIPSRSLHNEDRLVIHQVSRTSENVTLNVSDTYIYFKNAYPSVVLEPKESQENDQSE